MSVNSLKTPKELGFRMPAEWEVHERCWMQWPYRENHFWTDIKQTQLAYARVARAVRKFEPVTMIVRGAELTTAQELCGKDVDYLVMDLDDSWARDSGPNFVTSGQELAASVFHFAAWGRKYDRIRSDAAVAHRVAEHLGVRTFSTSVFMEGGGINVDGQGTILTTETCILNKNRNPGITRAEAERILCEWLGGEKVIWLPGDPMDLGTDGHVDGLACFVRPGVVLCQVGCRDDDADRFKDLQENMKALESATDAQGRALEIIPIEEAYDAEDLGTEFFCRAYVNFYIANGGIVFPYYGGVPTDERAQAAVRRAFPHHRLEAVDIDHILIGGGGIHCITQQQPAL
jgi:agmatine deiminase